ncbi:MAG: hypothetical protein GX915_06560 [Clostridiales bacterium]|nr:hypothetical protein [Clostridiales bacterium]
MKIQIKKLIVIGSFIVTIYGLMLFNILSPDTDISYSERRVLTKAPSYSIKELISGDYFEDYDKYFLDQFVFRDEFRGLKALTRFYIFNQKDNNKVYIKDGNINKMEYPLNEKAIINGANKFNEVYDKYLKGMNVSYSIIPDKNYFMASENGYLSMDYDRLLHLMNANIDNMNYIDIFHLLDIDDYYRTDIHWSQDKIVDIADMLLKKIRNNNDISELEYTKKSLYPFYGSYYGQAALKLDADTLVYLSNDIIENAVVYDLIDETYSKVYMEDKFATIDSYDLFLSGAKSILTISNPMATTDKELIVFRDSFGSSIAPLLLKEYSKVTLIDLRYMGTDLLGNYINFTKDQDVLFLYNTIILNNSYMLK